MQKSPTKERFIFCKETYSLKHPTHLSHPYTANRITRFVGLFSSIPFKNEVDTLSFALN